MLIFLNFFPSIFYLFARTIFPVSPLSRFGSGSSSPACPNPSSCLLGQLSCIYGGKWLFLVFRHVDIHINISVMFNRNKNRKLVSDAVESEADARSPFGVSCAALPSSCRALSLHESATEREVCANRVRVWLLGRHGRRAYVHLLTLRQRCINTCIAIYLWIRESLLSSFYWNVCVAGQLIKRGKIDYLVFDYLSEITMSLLANMKAKNPVSCLLKYHSHLLPNCSSVLLYILHCFSFLFALLFSYWSLLEKELSFTILLNQACFSDSSIQWISTSMIYSTKNTNLNI